MGEDAEAAADAARAPTTARLRPTCRAVARNSVSVFLLVLRHPLLVARQVLTVTVLAPGRLTLGVDGDDRREVEACGVDPRPRGRRMDEALEPFRRLVGGEEGRAFSMVMSHVDHSRAAIGLQCLGAAQASEPHRDVPVREGRTTFGKPIAAYQGVSLPLAEHATYVEAARQLCYAYSRTAMTAGPTRCRCGSASATCSVIRSATARRRTGSTSSPAG